MSRGMMVNAPAGSASPCSLVPTSTTPQGRVEVTGDGAPAIAGAAQTRNVRNGNALGGRIGAPRAAARPDGVYALLPRVRRRVPDETAGQASRRSPAARDPASGRGSRDRAAPRLRIPGAP